MPWLPMSQVLGLVFSAFMVGQRMSPVATHSIMRPVLTAAAAGVGVSRPNLALLPFRLAGKVISGLFGLATRESIPLATSPGFSLLKIEMLESNVVSILVRKDLYTVVVASSCLVVFCGISYIVYKITIFLLYKGIKDVKNAWEQLKYEEEKKNEYLDNFMSYRKTQKALPDRITKFN